MIRRFVIAAFLAVAAHLLAVAPASAGGAPAGCFTCESLCRACEKAGRQNAAGTCAPGCRGWALKAGVKQIYVRRDLSVCGSSPNAYASARCN